MLTTTPELDGLPDLSVARRASCTCKTTTLYLDDQVMLGYADVTIHCRACDTYVSVAASAEKIR
jgi:hypothetical protein